MLALAALLIFVLFALTGYAVSSAITKREEAKRAVGTRLATVGGAPAATTTQSLVKDRRLSQIAPLNAFLSRVGFVDSFVKLIRQAGIRRRPGEVVLYVPLLFCTAFMGGQLTGWSRPAAALGGAGLALLPLLIIKRMRNKRLRMFSEQLPDALDLIRAALQAGHGFLAALNVVAKEFPDPIAEEMREVAEEMRLGLPQREALYNLVARVPDPNLPMLVVGLLIAQESGGNLAEVLDNIGYTIRERFKLIRDTQVMTAQGRLSGGVLAALPFFVAGALWVMDPEYFSVMLTTTGGRIMLIYAVCSILIGHLILRRIVNQEV